ncbi:MAG: phosphotransferase [Krumholzibacteria bacterium]|nr:phosphotransferase [Candidatus Krumholzibacteria bacterium]
MTDRDALRGMILAAGYGTRLAPLSDHLPKPLLPVPGGTVLDRAIAALGTAGVERIAVNTHHLGDLVAAHLHGRPDAARFTVLREAQILGTGGALANARAFLAAAEVFLLHNGDVLADLDLAALLADHRTSGALATLVLVDWPPVNSVRLGPDGAVLAVADRPAPAPAGRALTYAGVGAFRAEFLADIGPGFSSLVDPLVRSLAARPGSVRGWVPAAPRWSDLGTLSRWLDAVAGAGPLDGGAGRLEPITCHGSDRRFWRVAAPGWSAVAMRSGPDDGEFTRGVAIMRFLHDAGLGAAAPLAVYPQDHTLLAEDVGPASLDTAAAGPQRDQAYRAVVDHLLKLQAATDLARDACPAAVDRTLDRGVLAWETGYFRSRFLAGHAGLDDAELQPLDSEFAALNATVAAQPTVLIHRDFQSGNILLQDGRVRLVDVQGLRLGPVGYDAASLLWDPYVDLPADLRDGLLDRFARGAAAARGGDAEQVAAWVLAAGLQRLMQALGAYGFLGHVKGKTAYLAHIPRGLANLRDLLHRNAAADGPRLPALSALLARLPDAP